MFNPGYAVDAKVAMNDTREPFAHRAVVVEPRFVVPVDASGVLGLSEHPGGIVERIEVVDWIDGDVGHRLNTVVWLQSVLAQHQGVVRHHSAWNLVAIGVKEMA